MEEYQLEPPRWRPPLRDDPAGAILSTGWPDLYESHAGQDEDHLSESNVTRGYEGRAHVQSDAFSAHSMIYERLHTQKVLPDLVKLVERVQSVRGAQLGGLGSHTFEVPGRTTLTASKLEAWVDALADPNVPLSKLAKNSVPRGYVNDKLLELFTMRKIPIDRAVWYLRAIGANDIRAGAAQNPDKAASYTEEWTVHVCDYVKKVLNEIVLPSNVASAARVAIKGKVRATLTDPALRQNWGSRFGYLLLLIRQFYSEGLLSPSKFFEWQLSQLQTAHLGQLPFVLHIVESYAGEHLESGRLSKLLVAHCLSRYTEIKADPLNALLVDVVQSVQRVLYAVLARQAAAFVQPAVWISHRASLADCFGLSLTQSASSAGMGDLCLDVAIIGCQDRVDRLLCAAAERGGKAGAEVSELQLIEILDDVRFPCDLAERCASFFGGASTNVQERIHLLLSWALSPTRPSLAQPFVVSSLLLEYIKLSKTDAFRLQPILESWLIAQGGNSDARAILQLFAELVRKELFSYNRFYDSMVASGETEMPAGGSPSLSQLLIRFLPRGLDASSSLRRKTKDLADDGEIQAGKRALQLAQTALDNQADLSALVDDVRALKDATTQDKIAETVLLAADTVALDKQRSLAGISLLQELRDFRRLEWLCRAALAKVSERSDVLLVADTISLFIHVWAAMGVLDDLCQALLLAHDRLRKGENWASSATDLLLELEAGGCCSMEIRRAIHGATPYPIQASPASSEAIPELGSLTSDMDEKQCAGFAQGLLRYYGVTSAEWLPLVFAAMQQAIVADTEATRNWAVVLSILNERLSLNLGETLLGYLQRSTEADFKPAGLLEHLVQLNVLSLPMVISNGLLPMLVKAPNAEQRSNVAGTIVAVLGRLAETLDVIPDSERSLQLSARWRSLLDGGEAFMDLVRLWGTLGVLQMANSDSSPAIAQLRALLLQKEPFRRAFLRNARAALVVLAETRRSETTDMQGALIQELVDWSMREDCNVAEAGKPTDQLWAKLAPEVAKWHIHTLQFQLQLHAERAALADEDSAGDVDLLPTLVLDADPAVAQSLAEGFSRSTVERLFEALAIRMAKLLDSGPAVSEDTSWTRLALLCSWLLQSTQTAEGQPLQLTSDTKRQLLASVSKKLQSAPASEGHNHLRSALFALCAVLCCRSQGPDSEEELQPIARHLVALIARAVADPFYPAQLRILLEDALSFSLDGRLPSSSLFRVAREALKAESGSQDALSSVHWLLRTAPSSPAAALPIPPWDLFEVSTSAGSNSSSLDLQRYGGQTLARGLAARQKPDGQPSWTNHAGFPQGAQSRFDSEWPIARETALGRDFRRGIVDESPAQYAGQATVTPAITLSNVIDVDALDVKGPPLKRKATDEGQRKGTGAAKIRKK